jgi:transcriptional regulator GlxA family with amidase domain
MLLALGDRGGVAPSLSPLLMTTHRTKNQRTVPWNDRGRFERAAERYLQDCFRGSRTVRVKGLAKALEITPEYAGWLGSTLLGVRLIDWLRERQVAYAIKLLRRRALSVEEVAPRAGFGGVRAMQRAFQRFKGMTASEAREL